MTGNPRDEFQLLKALKVLGLTPGCSGVELKKAYRRLCMVWHPDRFPDDPDLQKEANTRIAEINAAYAYARPIVERQEASRRQAEEKARKQREARQTQSAEADPGRKAGASGSGGSQAKADEHEFERRVAERAEQLATERVRQYKRKLIIAGGLIALAAFVVGSSSLSSYAVANYDDGFAVGKQAGREAAEADAQSRAADSYADGLYAGKASATPVGRYISVGNPFAGYPNFSPNSANTWYVISIIENPVASERSFAPYVIDAYFTTGKTGGVRQVSTSSLPSSWWSYTTREKK